MLANRNLGRVAGYLLVTASACAFSCETWAQAPSVTDQVSVLTNDSANNGNFATGLFFGNSEIVTSGNSGIFGFASQGTTNESLFSRSDAALANQVVFSVPYSSTLTGSWTLHVSTTQNFTPATTTVSSTPAVGSVGAMPFVGSISISASNPLSPTISWTAPTATDIAQALSLGNSNPTPAISQVTVSVSDNSAPIQVTNINPHAGVNAVIPFGQSFSQANIIYSSGVLPGGSSASNFTIPLSNNNPANSNYGTGNTPVLQYGHTYSIAINLQNTVSGSTDNPACVLCNVDSRSRSYFDYTPINPTSVGLPANAVINLPSTTPVPTTSGQFAGAPYSFSNVQIQSNGMTYIDPLAAYGFLYNIGMNDPNFASVDPVTNVGGGIYQLWVFENGKFVEVDSSLAAGQTYNFLTNGFSSGVSEFEILGIDPSADLDPTNITAFVTGLTFTGGGTFNGTMQALAENTDTTPLSSTWVFMLTGMAALLLGAVRRKQKVLCSVLKTA